MAPNELNHFLVAYLFCATFYRLVLRPYFLSPLCSLPGPPSENIVMGDYREMLVHEPHQALGKWAKRYGAAVHMVGPLGVERLMILKPEALHQIMAKDWLQYPRVSVRSGACEDAENLLRSQACISP